MRQDWRVEFVCGGRAERIARRDFGLLREASEKLGCATEDIVAAASRALSELDANFKSLRATLERLAAAEAAPALQSTSAGPDGLRVISRDFDDVPVEYLGFFATELAKSEKTVTLLAEKNSGQLLFAQHASSGKDMNALLKKTFEKFGGKGGGTRDFARGKLTDAAQAKAALDAALSLIRTN
jgi:alanyl-tRNA synthetase